MARTLVVRLYRPGRRRAQRAHLTLGAIRDGGLTFCGQSTRGMRGWSLAEHTLAKAMTVCTACTDHLEHLDMIGG